MTGAVGSTQVMSSLCYKKAGLGAGMGHSDCLPVPTWLSFHWQLQPSSCILNLIEEAGCWVRPGTCTSALEL